MRTMQKNFTKMPLMHSQLSREASEMSQCRGGGKQDLGIQTKELEKRQNLSRTVGPIRKSDWQMEIKEHRVTLKGSYESVSESQSSNNRTLSNEDSHQPMFTSREVLGEAKSVKKITIVQENKALVSNALSTLRGSTVARNESLENCYGRELNFTRPPPPPSKQLQQSQA